MPGFWRSCRIAFRWTRYALWLGILLVLLALAWINVVGVPQFIQTRIIQGIREQQGVQLDISRIRWRFIRGIVADNIIVGGHASRALQPAFTAGQIQLQLDYSALWHGRFQVTGVVVRDGILALPVNLTNRLTVLNLQAEVSFRPNETWSLDELAADFSGAHFRLSGAVEHAPEAAHWDVFTAAHAPAAGGLPPPPSGQGVSARRVLQQAADILGRIHYTGMPQFNAHLTGDARDLDSFKLRFNGNIPGVQTPWFSGEQLQLAAEAALVTTNLVDPALAYWTNALPFRLTWITRAGKLSAQGLTATQAELAASWNAPRLAINRLYAQVEKGRLDATAALDVVSRELIFTNRSALALHDLLPLLPTNAVAQLAEITWTQPPGLEVDGSVTLPAWTEAAPDWNAALLDNGRLHGEFAATNARVRGHTFQRAALDFAYADRIWRVANLQLAQDGTELAAAGEYSLTTGNYRAKLAGALDPATVKMFLPSNIDRIVTIYLTAHEPAHLQLELAGQGLDWDIFTATGHVAITNATVRDQDYESGVADIAYAHRALYVLHPQSWRAHGTQQMTADSVTLDFGRHMIYFTNGFSTTDPMAVVRCIGPKTARIVEPYHFITPPTARVHGQLPLRDLNRGPDFEGTDMTFEVVGGAPFRWSKLQTTNITGTICWLGQELYLTNVALAFYSGSATGGAYFNFMPVGYDCDFSFNVQATNVDAYLLGLDLTTNHNSTITGRLTASVTITNADSRWWRSWNGYGSAELHDGELWNIPIFGFASPMLNTLSADLGNNKATAAAATFVMTNGVAYSSDLVIRTLTMQLVYLGSVNLQGDVNARVTAQLLKNTPVVGSVLSTILWPVSKVFECQVEGRIFDPKVTPIYVPFSKYLLSPVRSLEQLKPATDKTKD